MNDVSHASIHRNQGKPGARISLGFAWLAAVVLGTSGCSSSSGGPSEGLPCTTATDCAAGQLCTAAGTCYDGSVGDPCATHADCAAYDAHSNLVGCEATGTCAVVECRDDYDCGYEEVCDAGACFPQYCAGSATACSSLSAYSCNSLGCSLSGDCSGSATSCYSYYSSYSCTSQPGCYWSYSGNYCSGVSSSCYSQSSSTSCFNVDGCTWTQSCTGAATSCSSISVATCTLQPGCYVTH